LQDDVVVPGAFANFISPESRLDAVAMDARSARPIRRAKDLKEDHHGLIFRGELRMETQQGRGGGAPLTSRHRRF